MTTFADKNIIRGRWRLILPSIFLGILIIAGTGFVLNRYDGRPICLPQLPPRGDDPPIDSSTYQSSKDLPIPTQNDWVDYGPVLETGSEGEWDFMWAGATPASVVKKDETYFFYYVAADGYRSHDGDARHRSIGVATSPDGIRFSKYEGNPIMTHRPYEGEEEGANSAGIALVEDGRFVMVYGAAKGPADLIVADGRYAFSEDGLSYVDAGRALYHCNVRLYGWGDEIFPIAVFQHDNRWFVYYQPNGIRDTERTLGVAWGLSLDRLDNSAKVLGAESGGLPVGVWGNIIPLDEDTLVFFNQRLWWPDTYVEVRVASPETPYHLSEPVARYDIPNLKRGVIFLDKERRTWFMYYNDFSRFWHVKLAPFGPLDTSPPTRPTNLAASVISHDRVRLEWGLSLDPDTGVVEYRIYRDDLLVGSTKDLERLDRDLAELSEYTYRVTAVNFHGAESPAAGIVVDTPADTTFPVITRIEVSGDLNQVRVSFNKPLDVSTATDLRRYSISDDITVYRVSLENNGHTLLLNTSTHDAGGVYTLLVHDLKDVNQRSDAPRNLSWRYTASPVQGLVGRWLVGDLDRNHVSDISGFGRDGWANGVLPDNGYFGAVSFDGKGSYIQIPGDGHLIDLTDHNFSFSAWVRPDSTPVSSQGAHIIVRLGVHPAYFTGISFTPDHRFQAVVRHPDESRSVLRSNPVKLGNWYQLGMVVDRQSRQLHLYVDGQPVAHSPLAISEELSTFWSEHPRDDRSGAYFVGSTMPDRGAGSFYDAYFHGAIADVRLYNRALSAVEIQQLWQEW